MRNMQQWAVIVCETLIEQADSKPPASLAEDLDEALRRYRHARRVYTRSRRCPCDTCRLELN